MFKDGNVTIMVADINRAVEFYTRTLGLELRQRFGDGWALVEGPGVRIGLHGGRSSLGSADEPNISIGLAVEKLEPALEVLRQRGVEIAPTVDGGGARFAFFRDPDQTPLYVFEAREPGAG
jgi:catechol 2,3-dioxygenase-like lactoylglutathione lyase family enzyme